MQQIPELAVQTRDINYLIQKIAGRYDPLQIYCFHKDERKIESCFGSEPEIQFCDYWLLLVLDSASRIENAAQDFVNAHYDFGKVTLLAHGRAGIAASIQEGYTFFANVCCTGKLLYHKATTEPDVFMHLPLTVAHRERCQQRFEEGISRAKGFFSGAMKCYAEHQYNICTFLLHQTVEQCCIALIAFHMDYRCDIHNLSRLITLCRCFTQVPHQLFISSKTAEQVIFDKLVKSYCQARYGSGFKINKTEVDALVEKVGGLLGYCESTRD